MYKSTGQRIPTLKRLAATAHEEYATVHVEHGTISYESWCFRKSHNDYQTDIHISRCVAFLIPSPYGSRYPSHMELPEEALVYRVEHCRDQESSVDTSTSKRSRNPKLEPNPATNTEKDPDDWISGDDPIIVAPSVRIAATKIPNQMPRWTIYEVSFYCRAPGNQTKSRTGKVCKNYRSRADTRGQA